MNKDRDLLIYLAGLWDGEGSFMLSSFRRRSHGKYLEAPPNHDPVAQICMTINGKQEYVMQIFKELYDGVLCNIGNPPSKNKNGKPALMWRGTCRKAIALAEDLLPFLRIKKRQAEILIRFGELRTANRASGGKIEKQQNEERLALRAEIRKLNHRGRV